MTPPRFSPPPAKPQILNPDFWRPTQYDDEIRDAEMLWLDRGECIDPELTELVRRLLNDIPSHALFAYPTPGPLYRKLAGNLDVDTELLMLTRGSDGAIKSVFEAYIEPGDKVLMTQPTYQMYGVYSKMFGADSHTVSYRLVDGCPYLDSTDFIDAIAREKPKLVVLSNPDNPTGFAFNSDELLSIVEAAGEAGALMLIDEAYFPFLEQTAMSWITEYSHLIVTRTFSKSWGMAGIRLGYTVAHPAITAMLNKVRTMVEADGVSMALVERMLDHEDAVNASLKRLKKGRALFARKMQIMGFDAIETSCNFVLVNFGEKRDAVETVLKNVATYRVFPVAPLEGFLRFTTTTPDLFQRVIDAIRPHAIT